MSEMAYGLLWTSFDMLVCLKPTRFVAIFLAFAQIISAFGPAFASPEDWVSGSPFSHFSADDSRADTFTSAFINVTYWTDDGWRWDKTDVGRYGGGYVGEYTNFFLY